MKISIETRIWIGSKLIGMTINDISYEYKVRVIGLNRQGHLQKHITCVAREGDYIIYKWASLKRGDYERVLRLLKDTANLKELSK